MLSFITTKLRQWEKYLKPKHTFIPPLRKYIYNTTQKIVPSYDFVREKSTADYITTADISPQKLEQLLYNNSFQRNTLSTVKYRTVDKTKQWIEYAYVLDSENTDWQLDVYVFQYSDGVDIYAHTEPSVRQPFKHLDLSTGRSGEDRGIVTKLLEDNNVENYDRLS